MSDDAGIGREEAERLATALAARRPDAADAAAVSRWMLGALSLVHAPVYRAAEVRDGLAGLGLTDRLACYLAARAAPLGPVGAEVVASCFYGFAPHAVARHVPAVWTVASPELVLAATLAAMRRVLLRVLPGREAEVADAAGLLRSIAEDQEVAGRTLAAAWSAVPWTDDVHVDLWLATTVIRESRGDAHVALLVAEGIGPLESHLLTQGDGAEQRLRLAGMRGWTDAEVDVVAEGLRARGLLAADGGRTDAARVLRAHIEQRTDERSATAWRRAGPLQVEGLMQVAVALAGPMLVSGTLLAPIIERVRAIAAQAERG
jgi:hypothetical protein